MRSHEVTQGVARAPHRSLFYAMGYLPEDLRYEEEVHMKRLLSTLLLAVLCCTVFMPSAQAASFSDLQNHWSSTIYD